MIFGDITNIDDMKKIYNNPIMKVVDYLKNNDFLNMKARTYETDNKGIYAQIMDVTTKKK